MIPFALVVIACVIVLFTSEYTRGFAWGTLIIGIIISVLSSIGPISFKRKSKSVEEALEQISYMSGLEFEKYCADLLSRNGFHFVNVTKGSGDFGADIIAKQGGMKYVIQCKNYAKNVGIKAVQEIYAAKIHYKADYAVVLTNTYFTPSAQRLAEETNVFLWDKKTM